VETKESGGIRDETKKTMIKSYYLESRRALMHAFLVAPLMFVLASTTGCAFLDQVLTASTMSVEEEIEFGGQVRTEIEKELVLVQDRDVLNYVQRIGAIVAGNSPYPSPVEARFHVVHSDEINAFAIPGGDIYIHTGLIDAADDEAELAGVMAHEFGHVVHRHGAQHASRATTAGILQGVLLGEEAGAVAKATTSILAQGVIQNYSREAEREADSIAVPTLSNAGYDPYAMKTFFDKLIARYGDQTGPVTLFASHPPTSERIANVEAMIQQLPPQAENYRPINDLRKIQARLTRIGLAPAE